MPPFRQEVPVPVRYMVRLPHYMLSLFTDDQWPSKDGEMGEGGDMYTKKMPFFPFYSDNTDNFQFIIKLQQGWKKPGFF